MQSIDKGLAYFYHDTDARNSKRITALRRKFGNDGYAFWYILLEIMYKNSPPELPYASELDYEYLSDQLMVDRERTQAIVDYSLKIELIRQVDGRIISQDAVDYVTRLQSEKAGWNEYMRNYRDQKKNPGSLKGKRNAVES